MATGIKWLRKLLISSLASTLSLPAGARCQMEDIAEISVDAGGDQLLTRGVIDGQAIQVLIDTGSEVSLIWRSAIERLGLHLINGQRMNLYGLGGPSQVASTFVKELRVAQFTATDRRFPVAGDLPSGTDFILAEDLLSRTSLEFDLRHRVVRTMEPSGCTPAQLPYWSKTYSMADLLASPRDARAIRIDVLLNGHPVRAQIDSGASISIVSKKVVDSLRLPYVSTTGELVGIGRGALNTWIADVQTFTLGDETIKNTKLRVAQLGKYRTTIRLGSRIPVEVANEPEMLLGLDFLWAHHLLVDNPMHKMVFTYEGGPVFEVEERPAPNEASPDTTPAVQPQP